MGLSKDMMIAKYPIIEEELELDDLLVFQQADELPPHQPIFEEPIPF